MRLLTRCLVIAIFLSEGASFAQTKASAAKSAVPDPAIAASLRDVSAAQIKQTIEKLVSFGNRSTLSVEQPAASGHGIAAARDWIKVQFESYAQACDGCLEVKLDTFTQPVSGRIAKPTEISNVYAILRGTDAASANRIVLVTGHYDSRNSDNANTTDAAPGANDDGSGTAVSLECARVLSRHKFPATIIFLTVAGEEQGLYGSEHFAQMAKQHGWQIEAVLNNDIVGGNRTPGETGQRTDTVRVFSEGIPTNADEKQLYLLRALGGENDSPSRELARTIAEIAQTYMPKRFQPTLIYRRDRYLRGGDHISFNEQGYTAVRFTEWREDYNHQHQNVRTENGIEFGDLPKFVDYDYVANVARVNAATLAELASAPAPPQQVRLQTKKLENTTTLTWKEESAEGLIGIEILHRPTDAAQWSTLRGAHIERLPENPQTYKAVINLSKDNVFLAVRTVDGRGHKSLPVVPLPEN